MARRSRRQAPAPNASLTAAATKIELGNKGEAAGQGGKRQNWHAEAWGYFDEVPEIKEPVRYRGNQLGKVRLYVAVDNPNDPEGDPMPVSAQDSGVPPEVAAAAEAELARLRSLVGGRAEIMRMLDMNLEVAGECYLVGIGARTKSVEQRDGTVVEVVLPEDWTIRSVSEVANEQGVYKVKANPGDTKPRVLDPEQDTCIRIWTRHPQWADQPDSAMRGLLGECRALQVLTQQVLAHANRSLSAGFFTMPNELSFGPADPTQGTEDGADAGDELDTVMHAVLVEPISDPSSAASVQPGLLRGPAEYLQDKYLRRITFYDAELVAGIEARIEARIARIARGLNLPVEKIMGHQQTTYANAAQVDEDEYNDYLAPSVDTATDALTWAFLWPQLDEHPSVPPEWVDRLYVAADPSDLIAEPDTEANADGAWDRNTISDSSYRKAKGFGDEDAPDPLELLIKAGLRRGILTADLTLALLNLLTEKGGLPAIEVPEPEGDEPPAEGPPDPEAVARLLQQLASDPEAVEALGQALGLGTPALGTGREPPPFASRVAAADAPGNDYGRQLTELDRELRARLLVAANDAMGRALERAANRLRSRANGTELRPLLRSVALRDSFAHLGPAHVATLLAGADVLDGAWDELATNFATWGAAAQAEALAVLQAVAGGRLGPDQLAALAERQADDLAAAWTWMADAMGTLANERMYNPEPAAPDEGEFDPTLRVPAGLVRQAIARAGGAQGLLTAVATAPGPAWVTLTDGGTRPAGGIGTGELMRGGLRDAGASVEAYRWVYGPAFREHTFQPHLALDGVVFTNFDDPQLTNPHGWPPGAYYLPGDHAGCVCDFEPIVVPAPEAAAGPAPGGPTLPEPDPYPGGLTAKGATEWMDERWGTTAAGKKRGILLTKLGPHGANAMASTMDALLRAYPNTAERVRIFGSSSEVTAAVKAGDRRRIPNMGRAYADAQREIGWIRLNQTKAKAVEDTQALLDRDVATGFHPPGTASIESVVRHEFGHHLKWAAEERGGAAEVARIIRNVVADEADRLGLMAEPGMSIHQARYRVMRDLSRYGAKNDDEFVAEAFSEVTSNAEPRPLAKALVDALVALAEGPA